jgi:3-oxoadipate enol-lactonase
MTRPRVLLRHAFPLDCRMWADTKHVLEAAGWHVSAPDLPGPEAEPTLAAWADRVLHPGEERIVPVGVSMGGYLAFELWRRAPERIAGLVLVDTRAGGESAESRRGRDETLALLDEVGAHAVWQSLEGRLFAPGVSREVVERARELALEQGAERLAAAVTAIRDRADSTGLLGEIDVPVLVVTGEEDAIVPPAEAEAMVEALARARLVRIPGAGHLSPLERPDDFARALLAFLDEVAA